MTNTRFTTATASAVASLFMAGCATQTSQPNPELEAIAIQDVICEDEAACRRMWTKADRWAEENAGFRFVEKDFNRIRVWCSFVRSDTNYTAYTIERIPIEGEKSRLKLTLGRSGTAVPCAPSDELATQASFKQAVLG
jgi:hypothetical protein